ncbi:helix-turn-helix domain-containing protein [Saccharibacillus alkalitolerans]|uniref:Cupin domain-containing protein n=1 Tax=Saccharibacillus alkalitolerans TaxID=2705290 RepID=A0ABX0F1K9_9BACL|nr:XRE family transcriptional regulator [Saccharibacillus alkalitolerans]NGZ74390.1 cupin domain-containing protein [Saccharibacillus alkalitolerans]
MDLGSNIRKIRKRKGITIASICAATGLSQGFMSQVENDKTSPSISTLEQIASALDVPLAYLLLKKEERMQVVRKTERRQTSGGTEQVRVSHIGRTPHMRMTIVELAPGAASGDVPHAHEGEEVHMVVRGSVTAQQGEDVYRLSEGDAFSWNACVPHRVWNEDAEPAVILIAVYTDSRRDPEPI